MDAGVRHLAQIVRRDVGGHADRDAGAAVQEHHRQARRQHHRLIEHAVEVGREVDRALLDLAEQQFGMGGQPRFRIAHRGVGLRVVRRAPVALAID